MTEFYFIRHGQTFANAAGMKQGQINTSITRLNDVGIAQAEALHAVFDVSFADRFVVSPLERTINTAEILNQTANLPMTTDPRLLEISYGQWDGTENTGLERQYPALFDPNLHDVLPTYVEVATEGETFEEVIDRVAAFMKDSVSATPHDRIVVVSHGFTIKAAVLAALKKSDEYMTVPEPANTSVTKITIDATTGDSYVHYYNRTAKPDFA
jgi:probable phosphoglycerate mutase